MQEKVFDITAVWAFNARPLQNSVKKKTYAQQFISSPSVSLNAPPLQNSVKEKYMLNSSLVAQLLLRHSAIEREENLLHYYEV